MVEDRHCRRHDSGFATVEWLLAVFFSFCLLISVMNLIAVQYGRGVLRDAADESARAGARVFVTPSDAIQACKDKGSSIIGGLGSMAKVDGNEPVKCEINANNEVQATGTVTFNAWVPWMKGIGDKPFTATAVVHAEQAPKP